MAAKSKKVWLTWMPGGDGAPQAAGEALGKLKKVGLQPAGAVWVDDLPKHGWTELGGQLADADAADVWIVAGTRAELEAPGNRYALSLVRAMAEEIRGQTLPTVIVGLDHAPDAAALPTLLQGAKAIDGSSGNWAAKALIAIHAMKAAPLAAPYRVNVIAHQYFGQWFEVGPREGEWAGVMLGVAGDGVQLQEHAVGDRGDLPERTVLEYPMHGIKAEIGGTEFEACAVKNALDPAHSYWVQVKGQPSRLFFGSHPESEEQDAWVLTLS